MFEFAMDINLSIEFHIGFEMHSVNNLLDLKESLYFPPLLKIWKFSQ